MPNNKKTATKKTLADYAAGLHSLTLAEQLVWAVAFVAAHKKDAVGRHVGKRDDRLLMYVQEAANTISDLRRAKAVIVDEAEDLNGRIDVMATKLLLQMTTHPTGKRKYERFR